MIDINHYYFLIVDGVIIKIDQPVDSIVGKVLIGNYQNLYTYYILQSPCCPKTGNQFKPYK